jgi:hypothetical protein
MKSNSLLRRAVEGLEYMTCADGCNKTSLSCINLKPLPLTTRADVAAPLALLCTEQHSKDMCAGQPSKSAEPP